MSIYIDPLLKRNIERAAYLELPFALHIRNSTAGKIEYILIQCLDQTSSAIDFVQQHNYYVVPEDFLISETTYSSPLDTNTSYTPLEIIVRSTEAYLDQTFESLLEHKNQTCGPEGEPPCAACIRRVHSLILLGNHFSDKPEYYTPIQRSVTLQMSKWPASRPPSSTPSPGTRSCTPSPRPPALFTSRPSSAKPYIKPRQ